MSSVSLRITTPLGEIEFVAEAGVVSESQLTLKAISLVPSLPNGMSVAACYGVLLQIPALDAATTFHLKAQLHPTASLENGMETGEGLEAQGWRGQRHVLLVGTEDAEFLKARLHERNALVDTQFTYSTDSLSVRVSRAFGNDPLSLHFIMAWNELPEVQDCSCWYAVDQSHSTIVAAITSSPSVITGIRV